MNSTKAQAASLFWLCSGMTNEEPPSLEERAWPAAIAGISVTAPPPLVSAANQVLKLPPIQAASTCEATVLVSSRLLNRPYHGSVQFASSERTPAFQNSPSF